MLVSLLFYGYATGVFSSRKLEKASYDSIAFRYICANSNPDHDTIASFRKRFLPELSALFVEILVVAEVMGLVKLGSVSLDGTKIKANASKHKALSWDYANRLEVQLKEEVGQARGARQKDGQEAARQTAQAAHRRAAGQRPGEPDGYGIEPFIAQKRQSHNIPLMERFSGDPEPQEGKAVYAKRKATVETVFGIVKDVLGFRQFLLRGLDAVQGEWSLVCIGWNVKIMHALNA